MAMRFLWDNKIDAITLSAGSQVTTGFPVTNLQHRWWKKTWRSANVTAASYITANMGANTLVQAVALRYTNFSNTAVINFYGDIDAAFSPPENSYNFSGNISQNTMVGFIGANWNYPYYMLGVNDANCANTFSEVGRLFAGPYFEPSRVPVIGSGRIGLTDLSVHTAGEDGQILSIIHDKIEQYEYTFTRATANDVANFVSMFQEHGLSGAFFITENSADPGNTSRYVRFASPLRIDPENATLSVVSLSLIEAI